jgi:hypothetical protein
MRRAAFPLSIVALGILAFLAWMHPAVLWPTNAGWVLVGDDRGQSAIGLNAFLRAGGWALRQPLLAAPEGMALLFTDSIPLLGVLLKPFAPWLPAAVQFIGPWYLACMMLQACFAALLVRRSTADPLAVWLGAALLTAFPVLLNRYGHASLCAQWLLLWSLWIFVEPRRSDRPWWWAAVLGVAALIHAYLLLMVAIFWGSAMLERLWRGGDRLRTIVGAALAMVPAAASMALHGAFAGPYASTGTYGQFPAALDAWWNPANPGLTALLPSSPAMPQGRGFEGFNYLGAGLLALVLLAAVRLASGRVDTARRLLIRRLAWLLPAFVVLALVAIGPAPVWRGLPIGSMALPTVLIDALDPIRAGGRLLWPITYTLAFAAIAMAASLRRATLVLGGALALQVVDLTPMIAAVRATSARADDPRVYTRTADPRWDALVATAGDIQFDPAEPFRDLVLMEEIGWRGVAACRPLRYFYASREAQATRARIDADSRAFQAGRLVPTRLYILLGAAPVPAAVAAKVREIDGVRLIPPTRPGPPPTCS